MRGRLPLLRDTVVENVEDLDRLAPAGYHEVLGLARVLRPHRQFFTREFVVFARRRALQQRGVTVRLLLLLLALLHQLCVCGSAIII